MSDHRGTSSSVTASDITHPIMVSVVVPTYQHAAYIEECLDGILMQRTTFPIEILVGEDESSDGTREICQRYAALHPDRIRLSLGRRADVVHILGKPTGRRNLLDRLQSAKGRYIAMCEGDDYWTDPLKLQKQVDFLEGNPEYACCFHNVQLLLDGVLHVYPLPDEVDKTNVTLEDLLSKGNFVTTPSVMYRNVFKPIPQLLWKVPYGDIAFFTLAARSGKTACLEDVMAVWRQTGKGAWSGLDEQAKLDGKLFMYRSLYPALTEPQRIIVDGIKAAMLELLAHGRYPYNPRRKKAYLSYLRFKHRNHT